MDLNLLESALRTRVPDVMDTQRRYAVLVPLISQKGHLSLLYEVRSHTLRRQPGEVCFPGGRMEGSESAEQCAIRETGEELGIPPEAIRILGPLDFIAHRANFLMYPILGLVEGDALERMSVSPAEVEETFLVPLSYLLTHDPQICPCRLVAEMGEDFPFEAVGIPRSYQRQPGWDNIPIYLWEGRAIWGLTGRITRHLTRLLREIPGFSGESG